MTTTIAFFGAGARAQPYLHALARRPDVSLTAVCDPDRRTAEQAAAGWGARVFPNFDDMLQEAHPQALWICVPAHLQADVISRAIELGIPFFIEPPGAADYERAQSTARRIDEQRLVTAVGLAGRQTDVVREAREYLGANPIPMALGWWLSGCEDEPAANASELLWSEASQLIDALRFFCGEVKRVRALNAGGSAESGGLVVQMEFDGGTVGVFTCATFARPERRVELELMGEGWSLAFGERLRTLRLAERDRATLLRCLNEPAAEQVTLFLEAVAAHDPSKVPVPYSEALRTLAVCQAATVSAREGRPVTVAELDDPGYTRHSNRADEPDVPGGPALGSLIPGSGDEVGEKQRENRLPGEATGMES